MNYPHTFAPVSLNGRVASSFVPPELASLDQWQVRGHLGSGASAHVWLLQHEQTQHEVACKVPRSDEDRGVLSQEADLAKMLSHENLVRPQPSTTLMGLSSPERAGATFWEFLPAGSLELLIRAAGPLTLAQTVTVLLPMAQVAQYLHERQIVHGDFSPANILFDLDGRPVLIDLGAVRATAHAFHTTGTPGFVAPEIIEPQERGEGLEIAADVYSLAAIGWFCLTATSPGSAQSRMPLVMFQPDLDPEIIAVLEACLAVEPLLRPPLSQVLTAIAKWAVPEPVDLYPSAGEEYELFLPTRKAADQERVPGRKRWRRRTRSNRNQGVAVAAESHDPQQTGNGRRRFLLAASAGILFAGVVATMVSVDPDRTEPQANEELVVSEAEDVQAVVDALAKARSAAWSSQDVRRVADYALEGSEVFEDDVAILTWMNESGASLEGIRMRAVVQTIDRAQQTAVVEVDWQTDAYRQRDEQNDVIESVEARHERLILHLVDTADGWLLTTVDAI